ncbi:MAG TPA: oligogalacturonate lyase family protein [Phycisphaerae bacterium]|nr:oligogalacturonate lyase family protein [Phycisphaerae bacterium]
MSDKGRLFPGEIIAGRDEQTGVAVWQVTNHPCINHGLYFLTSSFLPDEKSLVFAGFRNGSANFYQAGFPNGPIRQLTDSQGITSFSAVISEDGRRLYFTRGSSIVVLNLADLSEQVVADFPGGKLGEVDLSCDERWIASAIRVDGGHGIVVAASDGGGGGIIHRQERVIIHPQFHPADSSLIEYASDPAPRMHLINRDGRKNRLLYEHGNDEFVVHETWLGVTGDLVFTVWPKAIKRMRLPSRRIETIAEFNAWHISPSRDGRFIICDTNCPDVGMQLVDVATGRRRTICYPRSSNGGSQWAKGRYALKEDFEEAARTGRSSLGEALSWMEMKTDTVYGPQWTHPHPALSPSGRYATFTSDRSGHPQVYVVAIE